MMKNIETTQCLLNSRTIIVIGVKNSKRTDYFSKAAECLGYTVTCIEWDNLREYDFSPSVFVKIDPPPGIGAGLEALTPFSSWYTEELAYLDSLNGVRFCNAPSAIIQTLDKFNCKKRLIEMGIPVTPMLNRIPVDYTSFLDLLREECCSQVFIKPRFGSGAAGIIAYRHHPKTLEEVAYTSLIMGSDGKLYNTKKVRKVTNRDYIRALIEALLSQPSIVERWVHKANYRELTYDLRVVFQYGKVDYIAVRGSKLPITNLHLNNCTIPLAELDLSPVLIEEIEALCSRTAKCFRGLNIAGIDVLVTPSGRLKVIEVNGQGDLIYNDIFQGNNIYTRQIQEGAREYGTDHN